MIWLANTDYVTLTNVLVNYSEMTYHWLVGLVLLISLDLPVGLRPLSGLCY